MWFQLRWWKHDIWSPIIWELEDQAKTKSKKGHNINTARSAHQLMEDRRWGGGGVELCTVCVKLFKGTVSRVFLLQLFLINHLPPSPWVYHKARFKFFWKFEEIFEAQGASPVSTTPAANFATGKVGVVDTGGKFATGVTDTGGIFAAHVNDPGGKQWEQHQAADILKWTLRQKFIYLLTLLPKGGQTK